MTEKNAVRTVSSPANAREWLKSKDLEMLLGIHIGASGTYLCDLLDAYASHVSSLSSQAIGAAAKEAAEDLAYSAAIDLAEKGMIRSIDCPDVTAIILRAIEKARTK